MEHLAKATIHALMFFELVEDDVLDPDTALRLSECSGQQNLVTS